MNIQLILLERIKLIKQFKIQRLKQNVRSILLAVLLVFSSLSLPMNGYANNLEGTQKVNLVFIQWLANFFYQQQFQLLQAQFEVQTEKYHLMLDEHHEVLQKNFARLDQTAVPFTYSLDESNVHAGEDSHILQEKEFDYNKYKTNMAEFNKNIEGKYSDIYTLGATLSKIEKQFQQMEQYQRVLTQENPRTSDQQIETDTFLTNFRDWNKESLKALKGAMTMAGLQADFLNDEDAVMESLHRLLETAEGRNQLLQIQKLAELNSARQVQKMRLILSKSIQAKNQHRMAQIARQTARKTHSRMFNKKDAFDSKINSNITKGEIRRDFEPL